MQEEDYIALVRYLECQVERHAVNLSKQSRSLGERLVRLADSLDSGGAIVNSLGELQSEGSMLEARCGAYEEAKEALKAAKVFNRAATP